MLNNLVTIGKITKLHGTKGELIVDLYQELKSNTLGKQDPVFISINNSPVPFFIENIVSKHNFLILQLEDIDLQKKAEELLRKELSISPNLLSVEENIPLKNNLINYQVSDEQYGLIGFIKDVINTTKNPVLQVKKEGSNEILIPIHEDIIKKIDDELRIVFISAPAGLIELYQNDKTEDL